MVCSAIGNTLDFSAHLPVLSLLLPTRSFAFVLALEAPAVPYPSLVSHCTQGMHHANLTALCSPSTLGSRRDSAPFVISH